ncbi:MAG: 50S ribosomal protein L22 [Elusimicrobia bacterium]|nr:50S ribosomal protein L22 [Elusimicrobiota bacterium]
MEAQAIAKYQRTNPRKVSQVLDHIRGRSVAQAQDLLHFLPRRATGTVAGALKSAFSNLSFKLGRPADPDQVWVWQAWVGRGPLKQLRRLRPAAMGRGHAYRRKMCHLTVIVSDQMRRRGLGNRGS